LQVLDEADRLIEDDYGEQLETIFKVLPRKRQTLLFSATMTDTLQQLQEVALNKPFFWQQPSE
jgi:ATP-dependent RNA helicase DDX49/DBP8